MPYSAVGEPRHELKVWLKKGGISYSMLSEHANVSPQAIYQYCAGKIHGEKIHNTLIGMGCPVEYLESKTKIHQVRQYRQHKTYWNPWANGEIRGPYGVPSNSILMCPM